MKCRLYAALGVAAAMLPMSTLAGPTPTPSPGLDTVLAPAPSAGYMEEAKTAPGVIDGPFDAQQYVAFGTTSDPAAVRATLATDGFIAGYGRTWFQVATNHAIVEAAVAFTGGTGAKDWLAASEVADRSDPNYKSATTITGVDSYYGAHFVNTSTKTYIDEYAFVKGNDFYLVAVASIADDAAPTAKTQALAQYKFAPAYTVAPADWPAVTSSGGPGFNLASPLGRILELALIAGVVALVLGVGLRARRRATTSASPAFETAPPIPAGVTQLSPDRNFWWDGQGWRDTSTEAPHTAQRSPDGAFWWDGVKWRSVPRPPI